jgi:hypothetical protein
VNVDKEQVGGAAAVIDAVSYNLAGAMNDSCVELSPAIDDQQVGGGAAVVDAELYWPVGGRLLQRDE